MLTHYLLFQYLFFVFLKEKNRIIKTIQKHTKSLSKTMCFRNACFSDVKYDGNVPNDSFDLNHIV